MNALLPAGLWRDGRPCGGGVRAGRVEVAWEPAVAVALVMAQIALLLQLRHFTEARPLL